MDVPARLKWRKEKDRYAAYPTATEPQDRYAAIWLYNSGTDPQTQNGARFESWYWKIVWSGWFSRSGTAESKQIAADRATSAWWECVNSEPPRDVQTEVAMIVARALIRPIPNSLFGEDPDFLRSVLWHLHAVYADEIKQGVGAVKNLSEQVSAELFRRRQSGEIPDPISSGPVLEKGQKRPRRRHR